MLQIFCLLKKTVYFWLLHVKVLIFLLIHAHIHCWFFPARIISNWESSWICQLPVISFFFFETVLLQSQRYIYILNVVYFWWTEIFIKMFCLKLILSTIKIAVPASFLLVVTWDIDLYPFTLNFPVVLYLHVFFSGGYIWI